MYREFEGRNEEDAIEKAINELGLDREDFDVEVISSQKKTLFKKGSVTIRVHVPDEDEMPEEANESEYRVP